jgi:hypothetical protein
VALLAAMVVAGSGAQGAGAVEAARQETLAEEFVTDADETLGEGAPLAVTRAYDAGFDVVQIVQAVGARSLAADGTMTDAGAPVTPARPAAGAVDETDEIQAVSEAITTIARRHADEGDGGALVLTGILTLANRGYTPEQIVVDGLLGEGMRFSNEFSVRIFEVDEKGKAGKAVKPGGVDESSDQKDAAEFLDGLLDDVAAVATERDPFSSAAAPHATAVTISFTADGRDAALRVSAPTGAVRGVKGAAVGTGTGSLSTQTVCAADGKAYPVVMPVDVAVAGSRRGAAYAFEVGLAPAGDTLYPNGGSGKQSCKDADKATLTTMVHDFDARFPTVAVPLRSGASATARSGSGEDALAVKVTVVPA